VRPRAYLALAFRVGWESARTKGTAVRDFRYAAMAFRPDARRLAISAPNGELALWDTSAPAKPERAGRLRMRHGIVAAAWNPAAATMLATTASDGTVAVWRLPDDRLPECVAEWAGPADHPRSIGWVAEGRCLFSTAGDGRTALWDVRGGDCIGQSELSGGRPVVAAHCRGDQVVAITDSGWARLWHPGRGASDWIRLTDTAVRACAWSSTLLVIAAEDGRLACYDADFQPVVGMRIVPERLCALACSDGGRLVASFDDGGVIAADLDGTLRWETSVGAEPARSIAVAGDLIAVAGRFARPALLALPNGAGLAA
jgi:WD40 repeat protein